MSEIDRTCEFCGCHTNAALRRCCEKGMTADKAGPSDINRIAEKLARQFHEVYERLAPEFGYETRPDTREFDPQSKNGRLMVAVCREVGAIVREECAKKCETIEMRYHEKFRRPSTGGDPYDEGAADGAAECAFSIRNAHQG